MLADVRKDSLDVLRVSSTREMWEEPFVFGVRVHRVKQRLDEVFRGLRVSVR